MREAACFVSGQSTSAPQNALERILEARKTLYETHLQRRQLTRLMDVDDHLLADVGVTREDVRWALDLPFSYDPGIELQKRAIRNSRRDWRDRGLS